MTDCSRYARQLNLLGNDGQEALANSKVLCIGAGGLGSIVSSYLVAAGIGWVSIVDNDTIELSNLTRQITYNEGNCLQSKVKILTYFLRNLNSTTTINGYDFLLKHSNAQVLIDAHDLIVDCSDNFSTRYLVSDLCSSGSKPLISASINGFSGQIMVLLQELCYRCLFPHASNYDDCFNGDVIGPAVGIIASIQANEVIKLITNLNKASYIIQVDAFNNQQTCFAIMPDSACINSHDDALLNYENKIKQLSIDEMLRLYHEKELQIVDIRNQSDGTISGLTISSIQIEPTKINNITKLISKEQSIVVLCNYGFRSKLSASRLAVLGYSTVYYACVNVV